MLGQIPTLDNSTVAGIWGNMKYYVFLLLTCEEARTGKGS